MEFHQFTKDILTDLEKVNNIVISYIRIGRLPCFKVSI